MPRRSPPPADLTAATPRVVLALAVPAFLALVAEPLFLLVDAAVIGHLGTTPLAGLGIASTVLLTAAGLFIFLAYATTSIVARTLGAGDPDEAIRAGLDGVWLALVIGVVLAVGVAAAAWPLARAIGGPDDAVAHAVSYLRIAAWGLPAMLLVFAATGVLRGVADTRTPLVATVIGFGANAALTIALVNGWGWGIAGSAWGTLLAQTGMAAGLVAVVVRRAGLGHAAIHPRPGRILQAALDGLPLFLRTVALRVAILVTVSVAATGGSVALAAHHVGMTVWTFLAFTLDALAIAAQTLVGVAIGGRHLDRARRLGTRLLVWGVGVGLVLGAVVALGRGPLARLFSPDPAVLDSVTLVLALVAVGQVVAGYVFVADGILMAAGDFRYLAVAMVVALAAYLPVMGIVRGTASGPDDVLRAVWWGYTWFMTVRLVTLWWRIRGDSWLTGKPATPAPAPPDR